MRAKLAIIAIALLGFGLSAKAANEPAVPGQGLQISPPVVELEATPGQTTTAKLKLTNVTKGALVVRAQTNDFIAEGEGGIPKILLKPEESSPYSLKAWFSLPESFTLASGEQKTLEIPVNVPANASPGGHFGVIRFTATPPELEGSGVALSASLGSLVLVRVSGDVKEILNVEEYYVAGDCAWNKGAASKCRRSNWLEHGPLMFTQRFKNDGNVHLKPTGKIELYNMFGRHVQALDVNPDGKVILPQSIRKYEQTLPKKFLFGRYSAKLFLNYGQSNPALERNLVFWVIPYKLLALLAFFLALFIWSFRSGLKNYQKKIIDRARRE